MKVDIYIVFGTHPLHNNWRYYHKFACVSLHLTYLTHKGQDSGDQKTSFCEEGVLFPAMLLVGAGSVCVFVSKLKELNEFLSEVSFNSDNLILLFSSILDIIQGLVRDSKWIYKILAEGVELLWQKSGSASVPLKEVPQ